MNVGNKLTNMMMKYKETISYVIFGVFTTIINMGIYFVFAKIFHVNYLISNIIAWIIALFFAFITNKLYVFKSKEMGAFVLMKEGVSFAGFRMLSGAVEMAMMYVGVEWLLISDGAVKIASGFLVIMINYIASKLFIFKRKG